MNRHLPMLFVATLSMGGCHRNEPAAKAARANPPIRSSKEIKPAVISVTPPSIPKPVVIRKTKSDQTTAGEGAALTKPAPQGSSVSGSAKDDLKSSEVLRRPANSSTTVVVKAPSPNDEGAQLKGTRSPVSSAQKSEAAKPVQTQDQESLVAPKPLAEAATEGRMPWERPLYEPSASKKQKTKASGSQKASTETPKEPALAAVDPRAAVETSAEPPAAVNPSALSPEAPAPSPTAPAEPLSTVENVKDGATVASKEEPNQTLPPTAEVSKTDAPTSGPKLAPKKSSRGQVPTPSPASPPVQSVGERPSVASADLPKQPELTPEIPASPQPSVQSVATPVSPDSLVEAGKPATKVPTAAPKKLSEVERREEIRKQANESYHSGQQLIRESRNAEALQALKQSVKLVPESADAWLRIAYLLEREGKLEEARRAFKEAKKFWSF